MARLRKSDLEQMDETYFESLEPKRLVEVAKNLYELAVEQLEKLEQNSKNSSRPPSTDNPYQSSASSASPAETEAEAVLPTEEKVVAKKEESETANQETPNPVNTKGFGKRTAGKQPGSKGQWREQPLKAEQIVEHIPETCTACNAELDWSNRAQKPYMGYYQFELVPQEQGFKIICYLHHYYGATCSCGHHSQAIPGRGDCSELEGRKIQLQLQEYT
jgi:transposase